MPVLEKSTTSEMKKNANLKGKFASEKAVLTVHVARLVCQAVVTDARLRCRQNVTLAKTDGAIAFKELVNCVMSYRQYFAT